MNLLRSYGVGIALVFSWFAVPVEVQTLSIPLIAGYLWSSFKNQYPFLRQFLLVTIISLFIFIPILTVAIQNDDAQSFDVLSSIKAASGFVLDGKNPYVENYFGTAVEEASHFNQSFWESQGQEYLLLHHFPYLPGIFLLSVPFVFLGGALSLAWVGFFLLVLLIALVLFLIRSPDQKEIALALIFLNPFLMHPFVYLHPVDIFVAVLLFAFTFLELKEKHDWAGVVMGVLLATKIYVWIMALFIAYYWFRSAKMRPIFLALLSFGTIVLPFVVNNVGALLDDTILFFISGGADALGIWSSRPGLLPLLVKFGLLDSTMGWISIPLVFVSLLLVFYPFILRKKISLENTLGFAGVATLVCLFFSKMANINYLGFVYFILVCYIFTRLFPVDKTTPRTTNQHN